ncbi:MAG: hypothetical protein NTX15_06090, partial [Candidatus Kapabacteria bacterium]|nr:hypothetical protein [Candidatus Kapabacteria bacterium]
MIALEIITILLVLQRASELVLARRNEHRARERGGIEYGAGHYPVLVLLHVLWFAGFIVEGIARDNSHDLLGTSTWWPLWGSVFVLAQVIRYWAIISLGEAWNTRIIIVPGQRRILSGPYRYFPH